MVNTTTIMLKIVLAVLLCALPGSFVAAATTVRTGDSVVVGNNQTVDGNFYGIGGAVALSGAVAGDAIIMGGNVTVNGSVADDLFALGGTVSLSASMTEDVRIIAGDVTISEPVGGSLVVIAGRLTVLSTATIGGDVLFYGGDATIDAAVGGKVLGTAERVRINSAVAGGVDISTPNLTLGEQANITGDVRYVSDSELVRATGAVVTGVVSKNDAPDTEAVTTDLRSLMVALLMSLFATLSLFLLFRRQVEQVAAQATVHTGIKSIVGFLTLIAAPMTIVILLVSVLGLFVGVIGLLGFLVLLFLGLALMNVVAGSFLALVITKKPQTSVLWIVAGGILIQAALLVPVLGLICILALFAVTLGTIVLGVYQSVR